jgi:hypothetical protein
MRNPQDVVIMPQICVLIHTLTDTKQSGYKQKDLDKSDKPEGVYEHPCVGIKEIMQKERDLVPRTANYSRFSVYFSEWCLCPGGAYALSNMVVRIPACGKPQIVQRISRCTKLSIAKSSKLYCC